MTWEPWSQISQNHADRLCMSKECGVQGSWGYSQSGQWWKQSDAVTEAVQLRDDNLHWTGKSNARDPRLLSCIWDAALPQIQAIALPRPSSFPSTDTETLHAWSSSVSMSASPTKNRERGVFFFESPASHTYWVLKTGFRSNPQKCWAHHKSSDQEHGSETRLSGFNSFCSYLTLYKSLNFCKPRFSHL